MLSLLCFDHPSNEVTMKLKIVLEPSDEGGFTAFVPTLPGCISEGENKEDAVKNIREAIDLYLEPVEDDLALSADAEQIELAV
jgi:predicted RNase H-like HicB family nuclease